jgi:hypothetical protein
MSNAIWFRCAVCLWPCGYYPNGLAHPSGESIPPGAVVHSKPEGDPRPVGCPLWLMTNPAEFWKVHEHAPRIEPPERMDPK